MKVKRVLSALLCSSMLMLSAMPVSAAECSSHDWSAKTSDEDVYQSIDSNQHEKFSIILLKCRVCYKLDYAKESKGKESHSRVTVADLGHVGAFSHKYTTECTKCKYSVDVIVPCGGH